MPPFVHPCAFNARSSVIELQYSTSVRTGKFQELSFPTLLSGATLNTQAIAGVT